ncbi:MAG: hypothetical protein N2C14_32335 [Planctomycetales bacterium]
MLNNSCWLAIVFTVLFAAHLQADPCGMAPPIYQGEGSPITRVG